MMKRSTIKWITLPLLLIFLVGSSGCLFSTRVKDNLTPPQGYLPYYDEDPDVAMDNLVENFIRAWENRDVLEYRTNILFNENDIVEPNDEFDYKLFTFYYGVDEGETFPEPEEYDREVSRATNMFSGQKGEDREGNEIPGIRSIVLDLIAENAWDDPIGSDVNGDQYPPGTMQRFYGTNMLITLDSNIGDSNINAWEVQDRLQFHVIPVRGDEVPGSPGTYRTVYRIWKWQDIIVQ